MTRKNNIAASKRIATPPIAIPTIGPTPSFEEPLLDLSVVVVESPVLLRPVAEDPFAVVVVVSESPDELPLDTDIRLALVVGLARDDPRETGEEAEETGEEADEITDPDDPVGEATVPI